MAKSWLDWVVNILVIIGAINWGLYGLWNFNLVTTIFGFAGWLVTLIYVLVGLSGLWLLYKLFK